MTVSEAILTLNANAVIACEQAGFDSATVKMIEDALDTIEDALKAREPATVEPKRIELANETKAWLDRMGAVDALNNIADICIDWDGYRTANGLGGLINEIWAYARYCADRLLKAQEPCVDAVSREAVLDLAQTYGPATYDMPYGSGDMIIRPEDVETLPSVKPIPLVRVITNADFGNNELVDSAGSMPAWIEYRHGEEWDEYNDGNDDGWSVIYHFNFESEFYRCWTSRPTDEQMETTPWN